MLIHAEDGFEDRPRNRSPYGYAGPLDKERIAENVQAQLGQGSHTVSNFAEEENTTIVEPLRHPSTILGLAFDTMDDRKGGVPFFRAGTDSFKNTSKTFFQFVLVWSSRRPVPHPP